MPIGWSLSNVLISLIDQPEIENETRFDELESNQIRQTVHNLVDELTESSNSITSPEVFQTFQSLLKHSSILPHSILLSILDVIPSAFEVEINSTSRDVNPTDHTNYRSHRLALEHYAFLIHWLVQECEKRRISERGLDGILTNQNDKSKSTKSKSSKQKSGKTNNQDKNSPFDWTGQIVEVLGSMLKALSLKTDFIWLTSQDRDAFVSCFTKTVYQILEIKTFADNSAIRVLAFKIICTAAKSHGQAYNTQTSILQKLQYFDHLSEYMAELTHLLVEAKDLPQLADAILREISSKVFSAQDTKGPRSFSRYLVKLTELSPRLVFRQIVILQKHLDSESYVMRICLLEVFGKLIGALSQDDDQQPTNSNNPSTQVNQDHEDEDDQTNDRSANEKDKEPQVIKLDGFFNLLFQRFCDSNTFVRLKLVSIFEDILKLPVPFPKHRLRLAATALRSLEDKSSQVRKHCITVLSKLMETHPYGVMHGGELSMDDWKARHEGIVKELSVFDLPDGADEAAKKLMEDTDEEDSGENKSGDEDDEKDEEKEEEEEGWEMVSEDADGDTTMGGNSNVSNSDIQTKKKKRSKKSKARKSEMNIAAVDQQAALSNYDHEVLMKLRLTKRYYSDAIQFIEILEKAIPLVEKLLASKIKSEVLEAIYFFKTSWMYKLRGSSNGIRRMLHLIWSSDNSTVEESVKDTGAGGNEEGTKEVKEIKGVRFALLDCYQELYFASLVREEGESLTHYANRNIDRITRNMIELTYRATLAELTSLEELMGVMMDRGYVHEDVICKLWEVYSTTKDISKQQRRGSIIVLGMLAAPSPKVVADNLDKLIAIGLGPIGKSDLVLAKYSCIALSRIGGSAKKVKGSLVDRNIRLPMDNPVFHRLSESIQMPTKSKEWFAMAEQALNTIYALADQPDSLCSEILKSMTIECFEKSTTSVPMTEDQPMEIDENLSASDSQVDSTLTKAKREKELMYGERSLLSVYGPMAVQICGLPAVYKNETLRTAATLSLGKFMCVSAEFCDQHLMLLFKIFETSKSSTIRSNIIIALGDIAVSFSTIMDSNSDGLYKGLTDPNLEVKKNTLMVLTHLILNGMIKVKGQLGEIAKCIDDEDQRISDLAQLFFDELSKKDHNAIYNNLPDMISHLSVGKHAVEAGLFRSVMNSIFKHLKKDKQSESIIEKLCQRFRLVNEVRQWQDIAYCLSLLQFKSEKALKKLVDGLPFYQDKLYDSEVYKSFEDILSKVKLNKWSKDHLDLIEFEKGLKEFKEKGEEDLALIEKVNKKQKNQRKKKTKVIEQMEEEDEQEEQEEEGVQQEVRRGGRSGRGRGKGKAVGSTSNRRGRRRDDTPDSD
ncbi:non-SMC mitotic condensation complex subunit 1-domain-containing protein [Melampsora americana]|nr:non-SMC mitotic condensation complex subunit 1-domain-containing protein [Melampsora americana]